MRQRSRALVTVGILVVLSGIVASGIGLGIARILPNDGPPDERSPASSQGRGTHSPAATRSAAPTAAAPTASVTATASPAPDNTGEPKPLSIDGVRAYDPLGDGVEYSAEASLAIDDDPATAWRTERYTTADFGRLKRGVGLLVDLGRSRRVRRVDVLLPTGEGAALQLRAGNRASLSGLSVVDTVDDAPWGVRLRPPSDTRARYLLVWFTRLPAVDGVYRGEVAAIAVSG